MSPIVLCLIFPNLSALSDSWAFFPNWSRGDTGISSLYFIAIKIYRRKEVNAIALAVLYVAFIFSILSRGALLSA